MGSEPRSRVFGLTPWRAFFCPPIFSGHGPLSMAHHSPLGSFMNDDLGYVDLEEKTLQPLDNPFGPKKCNLCLRYELSPMSPGRTDDLWSGRWESNPRSKLGKLEIKL
jgi:hypothetical protein